jgi:hypothetical protein
MINKFYKIINNKYSSFFRFIFFLRYLFGLFIVATVLFLLIPSFFNYEKKAEIFNNHLIKNYNLSITQYEKIEFRLFPTPNFELSNVNINLDSSLPNVNVKKFKVYPKLLSIYNFENFKTKKIVFKQSSIVLDISNLKFFVQKIISQKNKLYLDNLNIRINDGAVSLVALNKVMFNNFGYKKNLFIGNIFGKEFKTYVSSDLSNFNFKILKSGINVDINFDEKNKNKNNMSGVVKSKILSSNLKFSFIYDGNSIDIYNSFFRNKKIAFKNKSSISLKPFLESRSKFEIENLNLKVFDRLNIEQLINFKEKLKIISSKNEIIYNSKKFNNNLIEKMNLKFNTAYGRLNYSNNISFSGHVFNCKGNLNLLEEYPLLFFDCFINAKSKHSFLKTFNIRAGSENKIFNLNVKGNLSILNKKINFKEISSSENYKASIEDMDFFEDKFENILLENFTEVLNLRKIKKFILEIS